MPNVPSQATVWAFLLIIIIFASLYINHSEIEVLIGALNSQTVKTYLKLRTSKIQWMTLRRPGTKDVSWDAAGREGHLQILRWPNRRLLNCSQTLQTSRRCSLPDGLSCTITCDPKAYNSSDAVILETFYTNRYPSYRNPAQKWVLWDNEAPPQSKQGWPQPPVLDNIKNTFNLTSLVAQDSQVPQSIIVCKLDKSRLNYNNYAARKSNNHAVAWFVSHCHTQSQRELYVQELQKYIRVDVYGRCGNYTCGGRSVYMHHCARNLLNNRYWFYLSFENSLCQDYITEKLLNILDTKINIIPVVMGGVEYQNILPNKTYIDVKNFLSPKHLADYLHFLMKKPSLYSKYIIRKKALVCRHEPRERYDCRLCKYLHEHNRLTETVPDITTYWSTERRCISPQLYLPGTFWKKEN